MIGDYFAAVEGNCVLKSAEFRNKVVLDIGTGTGRFLFSIANRIENGVGIDISEEMIAVANSKLRGMEKKQHFILHDGRL
ncbi:MAG: class I SAM-dependent methyltransferase [Candidatus Diapherotrites archaeon]|nr:class I SAM-dependent methyltransferase [Candidatus Diapherotrites archaeon]